MDWDGEEAGDRETMRRLVQEESLPRIGMRARVRGMNGRRKAWDMLSEHGRSEQAGLGVGMVLTFTDGGKSVSTWFSPALTSSPLPPERCLNQPWRGVSWWSGTAFESPTVAGPLKPPVSEPHASLPWGRDNKCRDLDLLGFCSCKN